MALNPPPDLAPESRLSVVAHVTFWVAPVVVALLLWAKYRNKNPFLRLHAATAFNFQASRLAGLLVSSWINTREGLPGLLVLVTFCFAFGLVVTSVVQNLSLVAAATRGESCPTPSWTPVILW